MRPTGRGAWAGAPGAGFRGPGTAPARRGGTAAGATRRPPGRGRLLPALAIAEELQMRPLHAHCHLSLGTLYRRTGRPDEARAELVTASAMLRDKGMTYWLPETEAELAHA